MKTHIIRCESFDSRASLEDRLKWVKTGRVLLVMPEKQAPVLTRHDLVRLRRRAAGLHFQIRFVTNDADLRTIARATGLAVFSTSEEARQGDWGVDRPRLLSRRTHDIPASRKLTSRPASRELPGWLRWLVFGLAVLALLAMTAVILPGALVELNLPRGEQSMDLIVPASAHNSLPDLIAGIPLYRTSGEVSASIQQKTSGSIIVGDQPARGKVIFTNLTDQTQRIPAGAVVRSLQPPFRYAVDQAGTLPAGPGTTVSLFVEEMDGSGPATNLPAGTIVALDPPLGLSVSVAIPQTLSGGTQKSTPALAQADLQAAEMSIGDALAQAFMKDKKNFLPDDAMLIRDSIVTDGYRGTSTPPASDRPLISFEIEKVAQMAGYYYMERDLLEWAALAMDASLASGRIAATGRLQIEVISIEYLDENEAYITIAAFRQTIPTFDPEAIAGHLRGLKPAEAISLISGSLVPGCQPVIRLNPSWWPWLPFIPERIHIDG
jgi:hypothetical protein